MDITIKTIPHKKQRYDTCGDYWAKGKKWNFRISKMGDDYEFCCAVHELIEAYLCHRRGISWKETDSFDKNFEKKRKKGDEREPGNEINAPYHNEHLFSTYIEELLADELDVDWELYEKTINKL